VTKRDWWKEQPDEHDYPAAFDFLSLLLPEATAQSIVTRLRRAPLVDRKAKDLLRASGLPLLNSDNTHVSKDLRKVSSGRKLSPVLLLRGGIHEARPLVIADGYHRVCASHHIDEDLDIPCRIAEMPSAKAAAAKKR
jgi:hypothetical protein